MFTHINTLDKHHLQLEKSYQVLSSGATGVVQSISATKSSAVTSVSVADPGVVTLNAHGFTDGQQINVSGGTMSIDSSSYTEGTYIPLEILQQTLLNYLVRRNNFSKCYSI